VTARAGEDRDADLRVVVDLVPGVSEADEHLR
jgi:hypothetical protein